MGGKKAHSILELPAGFLGRRPVMVGEKLVVEPARINAFASSPGAVSKVRADLEPASPDFIINITDALIAVGAFAGAPFPFPAPENPCGNP